MKTQKCFLFGIIFFFTLCAISDGRLKRSVTQISRDAVFLDSCADEIDQWSCDQDPNESDEDCIWKEKVCDKKCNCSRDCNDEINCPDCSNGEGFQCYPGGDRECVPFSFRCDGDNDCGNWEDEPEECYDADVPCKPGYSRCSSGKCINDNNICDGYQDCPDGGDEVYRLCSFSNSNDEWYITLVVIGVLLFVVVLCSVVTTKYRRNRRGREPPSNSRVDGRASISVEMTFPTGPPSYEATMSATMSVNPAFTDGTSIVSGQTTTDDDLPPPYESIAHIQREGGEQNSSTTTTPESETHSGLSNEQPRSILSSRSYSNEVSTESQPMVGTNTEDPAPSAPASEADETYQSIDEVGRHI